MDEFHRIYPVFLEFADQMENLGKDGIWELSVSATCGWIRRIYPVFLEFIEKNGKSGQRLDMVTWDLFYLVDEFSDFTPFFAKFTEKNGNSG